jgi:hypothetical protein
MATEAQIAANRRNAENSTGPKTERGKQAVARNALRHGLRAEKVLTFDEAGADFQAFLKEQRNAFEPADDLEEQLVERIAVCAWRLRRVYRVEAEMFTAFRHTRPQFHDTEMATVFDVAADKMINVSRYETALDRALHRAYVMLERRQARRRGEVVPAPVVVEVEGLGAIDALERARAESENFPTKPILPGESASDTDHASVPSH